MFTKYRQALLLAKPSINTYQQVSKSKWILTKHLHRDKLHSA
jgi:hypothetical protein